VSPRSVPHRRPAAATLRSTAAGLFVHGIAITGIARPVEETADWTYHSLDFATTTGWDEFEDLLAS
jgi:hypothetical protein